MTDCSDLICEYGNPLPTLFHHFWTDGLWRNISSGRPIWKLQKLQPLLTVMSVILTIVLFLIAYS